MPISRNQGKCTYDTLRTVTWECYALALNGFHECVLRSSRYPLIGLTRNLIFAGKVPFSQSGSQFHCCKYTNPAMTIYILLGEPSLLSPSVKLH